MPDTALTAGCGDNETDAVTAANHGRTVVTVAARVWHRRAGAPERAKDGPGAGLRWRSIEGDVRLRLLHLARRFRPPPEENTALAILSRATT